MNIEQLAPQVAAQIAAGEVIERPASVVKELVENSIDADATKIIVEIKGSGVEQIRVSDNGSGIPADELALAFQRHTTSKLRNAEDLQTITTLGFRGEALPSIASVSIIECHSRTPDNEAGTRVWLQHGSMQGRPQAYGCPVGTTFQISDLFGNTPVRKKFLRTRNTELNHIQQAVARYAMAQPGIKFLLITDSRNTLETSGSGRLIETILDLYDIETAKNMLELSLEREDIQHQRVHREPGSAPGQPRRDNHPGQRQMDPGQQPGLRGGTGLRQDPPTAPASHQRDQHRHTRPPGGHQRPPDQAGGPLQEAQTRSSEQ